MNKKLSTQKLLASKQLYQSQEGQCMEKGCGCEGRIIHTEIAKLITKDNFLSKLTIKRIVGNIRPNFN